MEANDSVKPESSKTIKLHIKRQVALRQKAAMKISRSNGIRT